MAALCESGRVRSPVGGSRPEPRDEELLFMECCRLAIHISYPRNVPVRDAGCGCQHDEARWWTGLTGMLAPSMSTDRTKRRLRLASGGDPFHKFGGG